MAVFPGPFAKSSPGDGATGLPDNLTLDWDTSAGAASHEYCYDATDNNTCDSAWTGVGSNTSANPIRLGASTTYYRQAQAKTPGGMIESNDGAWWKLTTKPATFVYLPAVLNHSHSDGP